MDYCMECGAYVPKGEDECIACGKPLGATRRATAVGGGSGAATATATASDTQSIPNPTSGEYRSGPKKDEDDGGMRSSSGKYSAGEYWKKYNTTSGDTKKKDDKSFHGYGKEGEWQGKYEQGVEETSAELRSMGILCYLGPLLLVPLLLRPNSKFIKFHCNQGLLLVIFCVLVNISFSIPIVGWIAGVMGVMSAIGSFFKGIANVKAGKSKRLPLFGEFDIIK